ncbi:hypothetical protein BZG36_02000 [Bifiguratus adelaidae]|uniref:D-aminoacyl-tRNA deacylase n=1 Tax=Bifiguratus adelaidae TaxID=1938954 RepID=A0A261Y495_9FUNG|nr:hypothetical protein BZG36_02000 [Bifiguratus adelaidae]
MANPWLDGVFGAMMSVEIVNDGPVTLELDSRKFTYDTPMSSRSQTPVSSTEKS